MCGGNENDKPKKSTSIAEKLIFSENNPVYQFVNFIVSLLYIFSSYFYIYIAAFRVEQDSPNYTDE